MERSQIKQILVVANRTAATSRLLKAIDARAAAGPCRFTLLIPDATDPKEAGWTLETALPVLRRAAKAPVAGVVGGPDPFDSVQDAVREGSFDEIIVSTLPKRTQSGCAETSSLECGGSAFPSRRSFRGITWSETPPTTCPPAP